MFSHGSTLITYDDIAMVSDANIIAYYLGVTKIPCFISSPLRPDKKPSFGLYSNDGKKIYWTDLGTGERGGVYDLLQRMWNCTFKEAVNRVHEDMSKFSGDTDIKPYVPCKVNTMPSVRNTTDLQCKVREWKQYDIDYWESYGVSLKWLKYAEVYPISHKIVISNGIKSVFPADKLAYAFVERKEGNVTLKIYQPLNKKGYKWSNKHDRSVISLWTKIPEYGDKVVICSSLKDALCLWSNTGIPALAVQGEGYGISDTAIKELNRRYGTVYIMFDNDEAGLKDGIKLSDQTGFTNVVLPKFQEGKDISDYYKAVGKDVFVNKMTELFKSDSDLPF